MEVISRVDAFERGLARFYTGRPCKRGHLDERFVAHGGCVRCVNFKRTPHNNAPNVFQPPSGYAFPAGLQVSPKLVSAVHAEVLATLPDIVNTIERRWGTTVMLPGFYTMTDKAQGNSRDQLVLAGWTDRQLLAEGMMTHGGTFR